MNPVDGNEVSHCGARGFGAGQDMIAGGHCFGVYMVLWFRGAFSKRWEYIWGILGKGRENDITGDPYMHPLELWNWILGYLVASNALTD